MGCGALWCAVVCCGVLWCAMGYGQRAMGSGLWAAGYGQWAMGYGARCAMDYAPRHHVPWPMTYCHTRATLELAAIEHRLVLQADRNIPVVTANGA